MCGTDHSSVFRSKLKPVLLSRMALRYIAALTLGMLLAQVGEAQLPCPKPIPIAPTSITLDRSSVVGSVPVTATVSLTDPCNVGGFIDIADSGPPGFVGGVGSAQQFAPGSPVGIPLEFAYDVTRTLNLTVSADQVTGLQTPVFVSTGLTIEPPTLQVSLPQTQVVGGTITPLIVTTNGGPAFFESGQVPAAAER